MCEAFRVILELTGVKAVRLPARSPSSSKVVRLGGGIGIDIGFFLGRPSPFLPVKCANP
jgi:hypothetical protein